MEYQNRSGPARAAASLLKWSAAAGLVAAGALTAFVDTVRHAALVKSAAQSAATGHPMSPGFILACGFVATFVVATVVVFTVAALVVARRARRNVRQASSAAPVRGSRSPATRGW
jgi:hypothetical protein